MTIDESEPSSTSDQFLGLIGESISYFPTFFDDPYDTTDFSADSWWVHTQNLEHEFLNSSPNSFTTTTNTSTTPSDSIISNQSQQFDLPKKRIIPDDSNPIVPRKNTKRLTSEVDPGSADVAPRKSTANKRGNKSAGNNNNNGGNNKEERWAEQLLNPCAAAITARNQTRIQHFLYVLHELASLNGDANHRLAFYGLRAVTHYLSATPGSNFSSSTGGNNFASSNPRFFRDSLIKFNDINPWFRIPNNVANTSILEIFGEQKHPSNLHILDIGVSHGVQWPTLLEKLSHRTGGPPPLVRLTVVSPPPPTNDQSKNTTPFTSGPPNYDFTSKILSFAKEMNINLQINKLENFHLQNLNSQVINSSAEETLVICAQFRLHNLNHNNLDDRTEFLRVLRSLQPKGVILSENNTDCSCNNCGDFTTGFLKRVEYLWRFLDSTSAAYKGRESDERRMMEAEAAKVLINGGEMNERKEKWCERMKSAGFKGEVFGEETIDGAKALLRKYDSNWEIRVEEKDGCVGLWWKGQPVSFCSLWKMDMRVKECLT